MWESSEDRHVFGDKRNSQAGFALRNRNWSLQDKIFPLLWGLEIWSAGYRGRH